MGVINLSPDSWYRESVCLTLEHAIERGKVLHAQGAAIIDVGAESTLATASRANAARSRLRNAAEPTYRARRGVCSPRREWRIGFAASARRCALTPRKPGRSSCGGSCARPSGASSWAPLSAPRCCGTRPRTSMAEARPGRCSKDSRPRTAQRRLRRSHVERFWLEHDVRIAAEKILRQNLERVAQAQSGIQ